MELRGGLLALCLVSVLALCNAEPQVSLSVSSLLRSGETSKACLTVKRHTEPMDVKVIISVGETNYTIIDEQFPVGDISKTFEKPVPVVKVATPVFLLLSALSGNYNYTARRSLVIAPAGNVSFIRTDKETYKGNQEVQIAVMSMDNNLLPVEETFPLIYVKDPAGNRLHQWVDQSTKGAFLFLRFKMLEEPDLGSYSIVAERKSGDSVSKSIKVDQYILPKFNVVLKAPSRVTILDKNVSMEVHARYTYDQGVPGRVSGRWCRPPANYYRGNACNRNPDGICVPFTGETDSQGTYKGNIDLSSFQMDRPGFLMTFNMQVTLTEQGTNVQVTESKAISITSQLGRAYFDPTYTLQHFKVGIPYSGAIIVENGLGQPDSGQQVELQVEGRTVQNLTSDENGRAEFEIDTSEFTTSGVNLQLIYKNQEQCYDGNWIVPTYSNDNLYIRRFFSRTNSSVQLQGPKEELQSGRKYNIRCQYTFGEKALAEGETTVKFVYMVISRSKIMDSGEHSVDVSKSRQGEFNITYETSPAHVPVLQYVIHYMLKDEVIGDAINLNLEKYFKNPVTANFSSEMATPGSSVSLDVTATPESSCLTRVFDASLLLLDPQQTFSAATVYNSLQFNQLSGYNIAGLNVDPPRPSCIDVNKQLLVDGIYWQPMSIPEEGDLSKILRDMGLHLITNTSYQQPELCSQPIRFQPLMFGRPEAAFLNSVAFSEPSRTATTTMAGAGGETPQISSTRDYFPELWHFGSTYVGKSGSTVIPLDVPGTITQWKSDVMCLSNNTGFGMTKYPANFTSFQKMFVDLSLPDSIIRGEMMFLVASVANYMDKCAKVNVSLQPSSNYIAEAVDTESVKSVHSQERVSYTWKINATSLGMSNVSVTAETIHIGESCEGPADPNEPHRKDTMVRSFSVEPEGIKIEETKTDLVCVKGENSVIQVDLNPAGQIVPGSITAKVQVMGDLMGRALIKPEAFIVEPTGCGEQNLATLMPIVNAIEFLNLTGRLTEEIRQRAVQNLAIGYMRQMRYRKPDGSFSAFANGESSAWLTLLSMKTMSAMKPYTFVDDNISKQGVIYLERLQDLSTGRFKPVGTLFNSGLKGGADDDVGFTCAVVIFLSQNAYAASPSLLRPAFSYLDTASRKEQSAYNYAMLFYAFRVSGNVERANAMYEKMKSMAISEGNSLYWKRKVEPKPETPYLFSPRVTSSDLEITATVLKALAYGETSSTVSKEKLNEMAKISTWLVAQQNIHGSYSTTSDSVAVMEALCDYGALVYQKDATNTVQLKSGDNVIREFKVDQPNRIILQSEDLPQVPGSYSMEVSGNGCALIQTGVAFHVPYKQEDSAFTMSATTFPENCQNGVAYSFDIQVNASYSGIQNKSNMVVMDIPLFSGYTMGSNSLLKLKSDFPNAEVKNNHLLVYLDDMTSENVSFNVTQEMGSRVDNFQQRTAKIFDYYEKRENGATVLYHPCTL